MVDGGPRRASGALMPSVMDRDAHSRPCPYPAYRQVPAVRHPRRRSTVSWKHDQLRMSEMRRAMDVDVDALIAAAVPRPMLPFSSSGRPNSQVGVPVVHVSITMADGGGREGGRSSSVRTGSSMRSAGRSRRSRSCRSRSTSSIIQLGIMTGPRSSLIVGDSNNDAGRDRSRLDSRFRGLAARPGWRRVPIEDTLHELRAAGALDGVTAPHLARPFTCTSPGEVLNLTARPTSKPAVRSHPVISSIDQVPERLVSAK